MSNGYKMQTKAKELCLFDNKNIGVNNMALEKHHKIVNELEYLTLKNGYTIERLHELLGFEYSAKMREHFKKLNL